MESVKTNPSEYCIKEKADIDVKDENGRTPLHLACMNKHFEIAKILIENGADVNVIDNEGKTPLHYASM